MSDNKFNPSPEFVAFVLDHGDRVVVEDYPSSSLIRVTKMVDDETFNYFPHLILERGWKLEQEYILYKSDGELQPVTELIISKPVVGGEMLADFNALLSHLNAEEDSMALAFRDKYVPQELVWEVVYVG